MNDVRNLNLIYESLETPDEEYDKAVKFTKEHLGDKLEKWGYKQVDQYNPNYIPPYESFTNYRVIFECPYWKPDSDIDKILLIYLPGGRDALSVVPNPGWLFPGIVSGSNFSKIYNAFINFEDGRVGGDTHAWPNFVKLNETNRYSEILKNQQAIEDKFGRELEDI